MDSVEFQDGNRIGTGEMVTMGIRASMFDFDAILEDSFKDETDIAPATPSEATPAIPPATPSEARPCHTVTGAAGYTFKAGTRDAGRRRGHTTGNETPGTR